MRLRETTAAHERCGHRNLRFLGELQQLLVSAGADDAAAAVDERPLALADERGELREFLVEIPVHRTGIVAGQVHGVGIRRHRHRLLDALWNINHHGAGPAGLRDVKRFLDDARQIVDVGDQVAVLDDRQRHAEHVRFLERALADHALSHLAGDRHHGGRVHVGVGDAADQIGCAGAAGGHAHAGFARGAAVAARHERAALLVTAKNGADLLRAGQRLMDLHRSAAGISEDDLDALPFQAGDENVGAFHGMAGQRRRSRRLRSAFFLRFGFWAHISSLDNERRRHYRPGVSLVLLARGRG